MTKHGGGFCHACGQVNGKHGQYCIYNPDKDKTVHFVLGFVFSPRNEVLLIRKNRPAWQAGKLNGIGGHIEPDEIPVQAMSREFFEETGLSLAWGHWLHKIWLVCPLENWVVWVFAALSNNQIWFDSHESCTDEVVLPVSVFAVPTIDLCIKNLHWMIPMVRDTHIQFPITIVDRVGTGVVL